MKCGDYSLASPDAKVTNRAVDCCGSNLYSVSKGQAAIRDWFRISRDLAGNLPPMPGVFPDYAAPIVRMDEGKRTLTMARWGMPSPN